MPIPGASSARSTRQISLHVLPDQRATPPGRLPRFRAAALIGVYVFIILHFIQWRLTGRTFTLVGSDAMYTLEQGQINGGFLIICAAALSTLIFGRFICGWACHMGGLQDGAAWLLRRCGLRPRSFRARLLTLAPLVLGFYMFIWPTFRRELLAPALRAWWPQGLDYIGQTAAFPGFSNHLITDNMWRGLPGVAVAVPFLLVCGVATVYFLGSRGLCRYLCPYGGILSPLEQLAPGRVVVNPDACDRCGLCTASCASGVRVMDETQNYGSVVSRFCTRSLDCIDACPHGALSVGWSRPALFKRYATHEPRKPAYDLTWPEEFFVAGVFAASFFTVRGLYGLIPMLMAAGMAGCIAFAAWKTWRLIRDADCRFAGRQLKRAGRLHAAGVTWLLVAALSAGLLLHSAAIRVAIWRAGALENVVTVSRDVAFSPRPIPAAQADAAARALAWYDAAASWSDGGWALARSPDAEVRRSWLRLVRGDYARSEQLQARLIAAHGPTDAAAADLARTILLQGQPERAQGYLESTFAAHPAFEQTRDMLAMLLAQAGHPDQAEAIYTRILQHKPADAHARATRAGIYLAQQRTPEAISELARAAADAPRDMRIRHDLAIARFMNGDAEGALTELQSAAQSDPAWAPTMLDRGVQILEQLGRTGEARSWRDRAAHARDHAPAAQ